MTERRRFFPAVPAQTVPGRTVDLAMRLQPLPEVPVPTPAGGGGSGGGGDPVGPALLIEPWEFDAAHDLRNCTYDDWRIVAADVAINVELDQPLRLVYVAGSAAIEWDWMLDRSHLPGAEGVDWVWSGVTVNVQDGTAAISVGSGWTNSDDFGYARLTLTAFDNGVELETVTLRMTFNPWNE